MWLLAYTISYALLCVCVLLPPTEFAASGLTLEGVFSRWLGDESTDFVSYHIRRSALKRIFVSGIPFGYFILGLRLFNDGLYLPLDLAGAGVAVGWEAVAWLCALSFAAFAAHCCYVMAHGVLGVWTGSPVVKKILRCSRPDLGETWSLLASQINAEVSGADHYSTDRGNPIRVFVTENWIIQVSLFGLEIARQDKAVLSLRNTEDFAVSHHHVLGVQILNIDVQLDSADESDPADAGGRAAADDLSVRRRRRRASAGTFTIRIPSTEFEALSRHLRRPVLNADSVAITKSPLDGFVATFKDIARRNPRYEYSLEVDLCAGCMSSPANVKLVRLCLDDDYADGQFLRPSSCVPCHCRPMWCIDCMTKWFVARQDPDRPGTWLTSKAPCPTCRSPFCLRDVCYLTSPPDLPTGSPDIAEPSEAVEAY